jgi:hypothetical protein
MNEPTAYELGIASGELVEVFRVTRAPTRGVDMFRWLWHNNLSPRTMTSQAESRVALPARQMPRFRELQELYPEQCANPEEVAA